MKDLKQIYDSIFECIFTLSDQTIIHLINGLYGTDYSADTEVCFFNVEPVYENTGFLSGNIYLKIKEHIYHFTNEMTEGDNIVLSIFEYGFQQVCGNRKNHTLFSFPEPIIICLDSNESYPSKSRIILSLSDQKQVSFDVEHYNYQSHDIAELIARNLIPFLPFRLFKLKHLFSLSPTRENFAKIQNLIQHDILLNIEESHQKGIITLNDAVVLRELTGQLYEYLYLKYMGQIKNKSLFLLMPKTLDLPNAKYLFKIEDLEEKKALLNAKTGKSPKKRFVSCHSTKLISRHKCPQTNVIEM